MAGVHRDDGELAACTSRWPKAAGKGNQQKSCSNILMENLEWLTKVYVGHG